MAKQFCGSYSKLKNFESCPFKHLKVDIQRQYTESSEQLDWGNRFTRRLKMRSIKAFLSLCRCSVAEMDRPC